MASLNRCEFIGRLTRDPEVRFSNSGTPVANFSIAVNSTFTTSDGERRELTEYVDAVAWSAGTRRLGERVQEFCQKGTLVYLAGRLQTRTWEAEDGQKRKRTEVIASDVQFLGDTRPMPDQEGRRPVFNAHPSRSLEEIPF